jgi:hypothetical protein
MDPPDLYRRAIRKDAFHYVNLHVYNIAENNNPAIKGKRQKKNVGVVFYFFPKKKRGGGVKTPFPPPL